MVLALLFTLVQFAGPLGHAATDRANDLYRVGPEPSAPLAALAGAEAAARPAPDTTETEPGSVVIQIQDDLEITEEESAGAAVVIGGDARVEGTVTALAVIGGVAELQGARVGDLLVVDGRARLDSETVIEGDIHLRDAELTADAGAAVEGEVAREAPPWEEFGRTLFATLFGLGGAATLALAGMLTAALAPRGVRRAGDALTREIGKTLLGALAVWLVLPLAAAVAALTIVAAPLGIAVWTVALPALALFGFLIAGIRIGDAVLTRARLQSEIRPIGAAALGVLLLVGVGLVPYLGALVTFLAALLGAGALALALLRHAREPARGGAAPTPRPEG